MTDSLQVRVDEVEAVKVLQPVRGIHKLWEWAMSVLVGEDSGHGNSPAGRDSHLHAFG
jgi:hypothetical protein